MGIGCLRSRREAGRGELDTEIFVVCLIISMTTRGAHLVAGQLLSTLSVLQLSPVT